MLDFREMAFTAFLERHILVKEDWLDDCVQHLQKHKVLNRKEDVAQIVEQWLYSDLADSTYPAICQLQLDVTRPRFVLQNPLVLQITKLLNIGMPAQAQLKGLTDQVVDDSGFEPLLDDKGEKILENAPKRCLLLDANDGAQQVSLLEYHSVPSLSLKVAPGSKVLLLPGITCRSGVFYLTQKHCQLVGGDSPNFASGLPIPALRRKLDLPSVKLPATAQPKDQDRSRNPVANQAAASSSSTSSETLFAEIRDHRRNSAPGPSAVKKSNPPSQILFDDDDFDMDDDCILDEKPNTSSSSFTNNLKFQPQPYANNPRILPADSTKSHYYITPTKNERILANETPPKPDVKRTQDRTNSTIELPDVSPLKQEIPDTPPPKNRISTTIAPPARDKIPEHVDAPPIKKPKPVAIVGAKVVKQEVIELDDEPVWQSPCTTLSNALARQELLDKETEATRYLKESPVKTNSFKVLKLPSSAEAGKTIEIPCRDEPTARKAYSELGIVPLTEALLQRRFIVGSTRKNIQAVVADISDPLRIVDGYWTQTVLLKDSSITDKGVACTVSNQVLVNLIGLTPTEATEIRHSEDKRKRIEGKERLDSAAESMERTDLVFEIEFFARDSVLPVIRDLQTMAQRLKIF
ncbi:unnamed protein product, partial [Mesorhabditis spiculigera]